MTETRFSARGGKPSVEIERSRSDGGRRVLMPVARVLIDTYRYGVRHCCAEGGAKYPNSVGWNLHYLNSTLTQLQLISEGSEGKIAFSAWGGWLGGESMFFQHKPAFFLQPTTSC